MAENTRPKRMLVHIFKDMEWIRTDEYPSEMEMMRKLREQGFTFTSSLFNRLGDSTVILKYNDIYIEIEEAVDTLQSIEWNGNQYISASEYMRKTGLSWRQVHYAYDKGRLEGVKVGKRNYLYIKENA